jgi:hypothetical protein
MLRQSPSHCAISSAKVVNAAVVLPVVHLNDRNCLGIPNKSLQWLRVSRNGHDQRAGAHMTWAKTSVSRTVSRTGVFLKRQIWVWPIRAIVLLSVIGLFVRRAIEKTMRDGLESQLQTVLDLEAAMLKTWFHVQRSNAESLANNVDIRQTLYPLLEGNVSEPGKAADQLATLRALSSTNRSAQRSQRIVMPATFSSIRGILL